MRRGLTTSTSDRIFLVVSDSSTSEGWNTVYCAFGFSNSSAGMSSRTWMPSSVQPWESATAVISSAVSDSVT